jgi:hypothetical protein
MKEERLRLRGRLEESRMKAREVALKMDGLRDALRGKLDKYEPLKSLQCALIAQMAIDLAAQHIIYRDLLEEIAAIERDLGED